MKRLPPSGALLGLLLGRLGLGLVAVGLFDDLYELGGLHE